jgi:tripartite ATP-independent transporter DctM subunit
VVPGLLIGASQMGLIAITARRRNFPVEAKIPAARAAAHHLGGFSRAADAGDPVRPALLRDHHADRGGAAAAAYALLASMILYQSVGLRDIYNSLNTSARITISIGMLIAGAMVFNYVVTVENIPKTVAAILQAYQLSPFTFLLFANILLLILGCFLEGTTILLVIVPVLLPTAAALGIDPVHFGVVCVVNIMIGLVTPPYGLLLFLMVKIGKVSLTELVREVMPFLWAMIVALALMTFVPEIVLWLPRLFGYKGD